MGSACRINNWSWLHSRTLDDRGSFCSGYYIKNVISTLQVAITTANNNVMYRVAIFYLRKNSIKLIKKLRSEERRVGKECRSWGMVYLDLSIIDVMEYGISCCEECV